MKDETISDLMRRWREMADLDRDGAGEILGYSDRGIEAIEEGRRRVDDVVLRIALNKLIEDTIKEAAA